MKFQDFIKEISNRALYYLSVPKCLCCHEILDYGELAICAECRKTYDEQKKRECSRCGKVLPTCSCSNFYLERNRIKKLVKLYRYVPSIREMPGNLLIYSLKHGNRRDTFDLLARELADSIQCSYDISSNPDKYIITNVPRRGAAIRNDGYDHSAVLAKRISKILNIRYESLIKSIAKRPQKETHGEERRKNARFSYKRKTANLNGITVILVDDVVTTGSSLAAAAKMIRALGARRVVGAVVSIAYKDSCIKPKTVYNK